VNPSNGNVRYQNLQAGTGATPLVAPFGFPPYSGSRSIGHDLTPADLRTLDTRWIDPGLARCAGLRRVDSLTGAELVGRKGGDYSGIAIPYFHPGSERVRDYRLRRLWRGYVLPILKIGQGFLTETFSTLKSWLAVS
jgi:hypothetical protein